MNMRKKQRRNWGRLHVVKWLVLQQAEKVKQNTEHATEDAADTTEQETYAADTLEDRVKDMTVAAPEIVWQGAACGYSSYQKDRRKQSAKAAVAVQPEQKEMTAAEYIRQRKEQLKKAVFKREILHKRINNVTWNSAPPSMPIPVQHSGSKIADKTIAALKRIASNLLHAAAAALAGMLPAVAVVGVVVVFAGTIAAVFGSPMGILLAGQSGDPDDIPIPAIVQETNLAFGQALHAEIQAHPECTEVEISYAYEPERSWTSDWPEVLAIFAVQANLRAEQDVIKIDDVKKQQLQEVFWQMHQIESSVEITEVEAPPETEEIPVTKLSAREKETENTVPEMITVQTLYITVSSKTVEELSEQLGFTTEQKKIISELLSDEMRPYLSALSGTGNSAAGGSLQWPLPGYTQISTPFGVPDAFGNPGHKGIDIPAPEGTPILAVHSGTVQLAATSDSYGNQVLLDSGSGITTRYAHMTRYVVVAGQTVTAG